MNKGKILRVFKIVKKRGALWLTRYILDSFLHKHTSSKKVFVKSFRDKKGIEIGGPSDIFERSGELPIYSLIKSIDNVNFSKETIWEGKIKTGLSYGVNEKTRGRQFILDTVNLYEVKSSEYDFVLASHVLEHIANPIKAIKEWSRILKENGILLVIVPEKRNTFDYYREVTKFEHIIEDFKNNVRENDKTHIKEILELHDFDMESESTNRIKFEKNLKNLLNSRIAHHHVYSIKLIKQLMEYSGFVVLQTDFIWPFHNVILCQKK